jgi:hypothetical protein
MTQTSLFAPEPGAAPQKPGGRLQARMKVLITVKAAPNPSETYGETVCVAGLRLDPDKAGWIRLYPINYRELDRDDQFKKYDIVSLTARPNPGDPRAESWRPEVNTLSKEGHLPPWKRRQAYVNDFIDGTMCGLIQAVRENPPARSLAAIRPREVTDLDIESHPGWDTEDRRKIAKYMDQLEFPELSRGPKTPLEAPRFKGWYRYYCQAPGCHQHRQGIYDWEWVALQRNLSALGDAELRAALRKKFLDEICAPTRDLAFFVGNQARHPQGFMILGAFWPPR